jgi:pyrrolidone-carboxylate peptidase
MRQDSVGAMGNSNVSSDIHHLQSRHIVVMGMWPPTNDMVRRFSDDPVKNPDGWLGENWRGKGYDIFAFFPEFPNYSAHGLKGVGDFQIDYRAVSKDFWRIVTDKQPCAIVTFSAMAGTYPCWAVERFARNLDEWKLRAHVTEQPDPVPPDRDFSANGARESTLPMQAIVDAVIASGIYSDIADGTHTCATVREDCGAFVSEFIGYHGLWYQSLNSDASSPRRCVAAGHVHVGTQALSEGEQRYPIGPASAGYDDALRRAMLATEITLEQVIDHVRRVGS